MLSEVIQSKFSPRCVSNGMLSAEGGINSRGITHLVFEKDTETYAMKRDEQVLQKCTEMAVEVVSISGHTLWDVDEVSKASGGKPTMTQASLLKVPSLSPHLYLRANLWVGGKITSTGSGTTPPADINSPSRSIISLNPTSKTSITTRFRLRIPYTRSNSIQFTIRAK